MPAEDRCPIEIRTSSTTVEEISRIAPTYRGNLTACDARGRVLKWKRSATVHGAVLAGAFLLELAGLAAAQEAGALRLELDKLKPRKIGCRTYFVIANTGDRTFSSTSFSSGLTVSSRAASRSTPRHCVPQRPA